MDKRINFHTIILDGNGRQMNKEPYSDWAVDEADLFRQYDEIMTAWELVSKQGDLYTVRLTGKIK